MRAYWLSELESLTEPKLRRTKCCKQLKCFSSVQYSFFIERAQQILSVSTVTHRTILQSMLGANNNYYFNGSKVCVAFLKKAFHYSTELIAAVCRDQSNANNTNGNDYSSIHNPTSQRSCNGPTCSSSAQLSTSAQYEPPSRQRDAVVSFLERLSEDCSDMMPDRDEFHLRFYQKREVYGLFVDEFKKLYRTSDPPSLNYFLRTWKTHCSKIKVRKVRRFTLCDQCDSYATALKEAISTGQDTEEIRRRKKIHLQFIADERMYYQKKRDRARLEGARYCSVIVDGADQSAFGLPHFTSSTKSQRGQAMKVKLVGVLEHSIENALTLHTMTEEHATGANHIVEAIHRFLNGRRAAGPLPPTFFLQLNNCSRENKNKYVMAYLESLVALNVFQSVEAGFLPVGHTHEDIDRCFSQTSGWLRVNDAVTLSDLHTELLRACKNTLTAKVNHLRRIANWSGLCENEKALRRIDTITQFRYFKFSRAQIMEHDRITSPIPTVCHVKVRCSDEWKRLFPDRKGQNVHGILKHCPNLRNTPSLVLKCPDGLQQVTKRISSEEARVNNADKLISLYELRDFVFRDRVDQFHWDLRKSVETEHHNFFSHVDESSQCDKDHERVSEHGADDDMNNDNDNDPEHCDSQSESNISRDHSSYEEHGLATGRNIQSTNLGGEIQQTGISDEIKESVPVATAPKNKLTYDIGSFAVVQVERQSEGSSSASRFWVGKVTEVFKDPGETFVRQLTVHWFDRPQRQENNPDPLKVQYYPCYQSGAFGKKQRRNSKGSFVRSDLQTRWTDNVDTDAVLLTFPALTRRNTLPLSVQKKLSD